MTKLFELELLLESSIPSLVSPRIGEVARGVCDKGKTINKILIISVYTWQEAGNSALGPQMRQDKMERKRTWTVAEPQKRRLTISYTSGLWIALGRVLWESSLVLGHLRNGGQWVGGMEVKQQSSGSPPASACGFFQIKIAKTLTENQLPKFEAKW